MLFRLGFIVVAVLALVSGLVIGTLNSAPVAVDLLWLTIEWPLGLVIVSGLAAGVLLGLVMAWLFSILPLRVKIRNLRRRLKDSDV